MEPQNLGLPAKRFSIDRRYFGRIVSASMRGASEEEIKEIERQRHEEIIEAQKEQEVSEKPAHEVVHLPPPR